MTDEETAWRRRMEWKIDRLGHHVTCLLLTVSAGPSPPPLPEPRRRGRVRPLIGRLLASLLRSAGEKLLTFVVPYLLPALGTLLVLGRHGLGKLWDALLAAF